METLLLYQDETSSKFWRIAVTGMRFTVTYGKIGSVGSVKVKEFSSAEACQKEAERLIRSKLKKGYTPAGSSGQIVKDSTMTEAAFWDLLKTAKRKGEDSEEQLEWLASHLTRRPVKDIVMFDAIFNQYYYKSYTSDLWAAAYIIMGGCSDDCFDYFRAWLLYFGKDIYEAAIQNPEILLPYLIELEQAECVPQFEELLSVATLAYEEKTGGELEDYLDLYGELSGDQYIQPDLEFDWDEDDEDGLRQRFPLLWARFGENPLG